ncbi:hypothetical protein BDD12DRAFT_899065 [Trichophaea hybrida]|nr:hypothetical protein BDD12DRAFT_899065 [Trichophaea hybrida]
MEPISFTIGVAGLSGLFNASLEVLDRISDARSYGKGYHMFNAKIKTERIRFFLWGLRQGVQEATEWVVHCFENSDVVRMGHGSSRPRPARTSLEFLPRRSSFLKLSATQQTSLATPVTDFCPERTANQASGCPRARAVELQKKASLLMKMKCVFSGKRKSGVVLQELSWFIDILYSIISPSPMQLSIKRRETTPSNSRLHGMNHPADIVHMLDHSGVMRNRSKNRQID